MFTSVFLLNIVYFSVCLTSKLYWIDDQLADVSTRFYTSVSWCRRVGPSASWLVTVKLLTIKEADTEKTYEINVETKAQKSGECSTPATNTNDSKMEKVEQILYLLDKFCVSDEFYHVFSMIENGLPRSNNNNKIINNKLYLRIK